MGNVNVIRGAFRPVSLCILIAGALAGCASPPPPFPDLPRMNVSTYIGSRNLCGLGISPPINIGKAPSETTQFRLKLTNIDVLFQSPWQTTQPAKEGGFAEGDIADYQAPCVGDLRLYSTYTYQLYRLEVLALDDQSRPLAYGTTTVQIHSVNTMLDRERAAQGRTPQATPGPETPAAPTMLPYDDTIGPRINPVLIPPPPGPVYQP
jgi:hypothetical protein